MLPDSAMGTPPGMSAKPGLLSNLSPDGSPLSDASGKPGFTSKAGGYQGQLLMSKMSRLGMLGPDLMDLPIDHEFQYTHSGLPGGDTTVNVINNAPRPQEVDRHGTVQYLRPDNGSRRSHHPGGNSTGTNQTFHP